MGQGKESYELIIFNNFDSSLFEEQNEGYQSLKLKSDRLLEKFLLIVVTDQTETEIEFLRSLFRLKTLSIKKRLDNLNYNRNAVFETRPRTIFLPILGVRSFLR